MTERIGYNHRLLRPLTNAAAVGINRGYAVGYYCPPDISFRLNGNNLASSADPCCIVW